VIYITQLIYISEGQESIFHQFEDKVLPVISKYNGQLLLRLRPSQNEIVENLQDNPYEVHIIRFETEADFESFMRDDERKNSLYLKEQSVKSSMLIKGTLIS
jgi:uncharacterized protein (DUF1330 family)